MIALPVFEKLLIRNYGLFPGQPEGSGIEFDFVAGVTLIAGINGLGKTTLITALLRLLTGPVDLSGTGLPLQIGSTLPKEPVQLRAEGLRFFGQRVADDAREAKAILQVRFKQTEVRITRDLRNLSLSEFRVNGEPVLSKDDLEAAFQSTICRLMNLSSFVDVLLLLHYVVFFPERRPGSLWDLNAQRQLLRAIFLPKNDAARVAELERKVGSADSLARNLGYALSTQEKRLREAQELHAAAPALRTKMRAKKALLDADLEKRQMIETKRAELEAARRVARLELERSKIEREDSERAIEKIKFGALSRMFPDMADAARLTLLTLISKSDCLVCGSHTDEARRDIEQKLAHGICPICNSPPERQAKVVKVREVEAARIKSSQKRVQLAVSEEVAQQKRWNEINIQYSQTVDMLQKISHRIDELQIEIKGITAELPTPSHKIVELEKFVRQLSDDVEAAKARRAEVSKQLRRVLATKNQVVVKNANRLARKFSANCKMLLSEEAILARIEGEAGITQAAEQFAVPLFRIDMSAAARPGLTRRATAQDVSESQRELIDLAFRFALIEVATAGADATLIMETPEASLDGIAMERVGKALYSFASEGNNRLIATSNLSNAGIIGFLFGGISRSKKELQDRRSRTIDLLTVSAKNQALRHDRKGRYAALLQLALEGHDVGS